MSTRGPLKLSDRVEDPRRRLRPLPELEDPGPDGDEHRRFPRAKMDIRFALRVGSGETPKFQASLASENLSVSGAFLHSTFFLPLGTEMEVRFVLPVGEEVTARADVVREERPDGAGRGRSGMGIRFLEFQGQSEVALARVFVGQRLRTFVEGYLKTQRARKFGSEVDRVVDALAAWELMQVRQPEDPWHPEGRGQG
jgi:hypothetical protein